MNTLPADLVRQLFGGTVIAVDVTPRIDLVAGVDYGERLSGWYAAWRALKPFGPRLRVPNIHAILERTTVLASVQRAAALASGGADVYIHPPVDHFGSFAVKAIDQIVDAGYRAAQEPLAAWMAGRSV
jgi:predicted acylesterase/phospholipase RssA